jgi:hypothetical protein
VSTPPPAFCPKDDIWVTKVNRMMCVEELGAADIGISSTQRNSRSREPDFIYTESTKMSVVAEDFLRCAHFFISMRWLSEDLI